MLGRLAFAGVAGLGVKDCAGADGGLTALLTLDAAWSTNDETVDNALIAAPTAAIMAVPPACLTASFLPAGANAKSCV
jgi:hypothetical protein